MDLKIIGGILLIVGTSIGAGMLALPIATAQLGFVGSIVLMGVCWFVMTIGAFYILEANLWMPQNSNLVTMAKATIGPVGQIISWVTYLLLLYSLLCAYIAAGSDLFHHLLMSAGMKLSLGLSALVFTFLFGTIVFFGIRAVDYANRGFMSVKFAAYFVLIFLLFPFVSSQNLTTGNLQYLISSTALMVTITSFGYASIIPSLRVYFSGDIKKLKTVILIGSLIPLLCYIFWDAAIMGVIPLEGPHGLIAILKSQLSTSEFVQTLSEKVVTTQVTFFAKLFTSICVLTSFFRGIFMPHRLFSGWLTSRKTRFFQFFYTTFDFFSSTHHRLVFSQCFYKSIAICRYLLRCITHPFADLDGLARSIP